jgi:bacterioferritin-associated ferredoxin
VILCHCRRVSDRDVRAAAQRCPFDPELIAKDCGAAQRCGGCRPAFDALLAELAA